MSLTPVDILIEEYKTLRQESLNTINSRLSILSLGFASISLAISASVTALANSIKIIPGLILSLLIPLIVFFVLTLWFGEYQRMQRAGKFLALLEMRINHVMNDEIILSWENYLRIKGMSNKIVFPYNATIFILTLLSFLSMLIGVGSLLYTIIAKFWGVSIIKIVIILVVIIIIAIHIRVYLSYASKAKKLREIRITYQEFQSYKESLENLKLEEGQLKINKQNN